jgi:predicted RNA methylase
MTVAEITIRHNFEDGTLVYGSVKGDGVYELIGTRTAAHFRYFPSIRQIGIQQSRDRPAKRWQIEQAREALEAAGHTVTVEIDDTPRDMGEVRADVAERLDARHDRLTARAQRHAAEAEARSDAAQQISERFAGGQPILVGHHSERRARRDHERMDGHMAASVAATRKAEDTDYAASRVGSQEAYRQRPGTIVRRMEKTQAELRKIQRLIDGTQHPDYVRNPETGRYRLVATPATGKYLEALESRKAWHEHTLADDRKLLDEHVAAGWVEHSPETIHKGDVVTWSTRWDDEATVIRVNPKTVSLDRRSYPSKVGYEQIKTVKCPHQGTETATGPGAPRAVPKREGAGVAERLEQIKAAPKPQEPLRVGAGTECFTSPPAVVARILAAAGPLDGKTVLEPSAGTGAIARAAVEAGATVDVIELEWQLWQRLQDAGLYRSVNHGDFLEAQPGGTGGDVPLYDAVLMNPPFRNQADIKHVTHALRFVKPGGVLVAVMSASVAFRQNPRTDTFRKLVLAHGGRIDHLPDDAFEPSGTSIRTVLVTIPKREEG